MWAQCLLGTKGLKPVWAWKCPCGLKVMNTHEGYNVLRGQEKACVGLRVLCGLEALKVHAGKMARWCFMVKRIKACVGLESPFGPDESTFPLCTGAYGTRSTEDQIDNL